MKSKKFLLTILLGVGLLIGCASNNNEHDNSNSDYPFLTLNLTLDKVFYRPHDPIFARLLLKNIGGNTVIVNKRMISNLIQAPDPFRDVSFLIISPSGQSVPWGVRKDVEFLRTNDFVALAPGAEIEALYDLENDYMITSEAGEYIVIAYYKNVADPDDNQIAWKGELTSNLVTFRIKP